MKLWGILRFELAYQARRPWPWLFFAVVLVVCFLMTRDSALSNTMYEDFLVNASFAVASTSVFGGLIWLLVAPVIAGEAAARDVSTRMYPLVYTASVGATEFLVGRFLAALLLNAVLLLAVPIGILLATYSPGVSPEVVGPFRPAVYLTAYGFLTLPNAIVATTIQFVVALRTGRAMTSYLGSLFLLFMGFFVASLLLFRRGLGTLVDPIGIRFIVEDLAHDWTTIERNTRLLALEGTLLTNRLLWLGVALGVLTLTVLSFRFAHRAETRRWWRVRRGGETVIDAWPAGRVVERRAPTATLPVPRSFGAGIQLRKTLAIALTSLRTIVFSLAGLGLLAFIPLLTVPVLVDQMYVAGIPVVPITARILSELTGPISNELSRWVIVPLALVFFAGELVWREREAGVNEITDALPGSEWPQLAGKLLALTGVLVAFSVMQIVAGVVAQTIMGHQDFEIGLYLRVLLGLQLPEYLLFTVLALVVHVVVNQKYIGHLVAIMAYVFVSVLAGMLGIEHNLLVYGGAPSWSYTELRGFGGSVGPWLWFKLYWAAWALLLAVAARLLWVRGREPGFRVRLEWARRRLRGATAVIAGVGASLVLLVGGFVFYNTNVLNPYRGASDIASLRAEYERRYGRFEEAAQPVLTAVTLRAEIHPERRSANVRGTYRLVNGTAQRIDSILVATSGSVETRTIALGRPSRLAVDDAEHRQRLYVLAEPLLPGDSLTLDFEVQAGSRGFGNRGTGASIAPGGSYFDAAWFPAIGYQRNRALITAAERREHGLPPRPVIASLYESEEREPTVRGGGIAFEAIVGTSAGQTAVAPGALRRTWTEGGRRYFHYVTDAPIGREWSFFSAEYAVREARWNDVVIRIFHHPKHTAHLDRTVRGVQASLAYLAQELGPYPYRHLTVVENAVAPGTGLHADAAMISHGQAFPLWRPTDPGSVDFPYAVMAHEMAHQWTLPYAFVEGAPFLSEGLAWYSAMQVVKASRGDTELQRLLRTMREPTQYRPIRRGEPLLRGLDPYMSYRRGPFAMYALSEYAGADRVNGALRRLIATHEQPGAPLATTLDLYRELQTAVPDSLRYLLHDLFEVNTLWQLAAERVAAVDNGDGTWRVTLDVTARKIVYDSAGVESEVPMDELIPIGVFGEARQGADELSAPLHLQMHRMRSGRSTVTVTVTGKPRLAGIDPHHLLDWEEQDDDDNVDAVTIETGSRSGNRTGKTP